MSLRPSTLDLGLAARRLSIAALAGLAAYFHWSLGSTIFLLNAAGYLVLGVAAVALPRYGAFARLALLAFTVTTITLWVFIGARFDLAYTTEAVEAVLVMVLLIDLRAELLHGLRRPGTRPPTIHPGRPGRHAESL